MKLPVLPRPSKMEFPKGNTDILHNDVSRSHSHISMDRSISHGGVYINRIPSSALNGLTPYQQLYNAKPAYNHLRIFGCTTFVHVHPQQRDKLSPKAIQTVFLGYDDHLKGTYRCYDRSSKRILLSSDVTFNEEQFLYTEELMTLIHQPNSCERLWVRIEMKNRMTSRRRNNA